jgi:uncharacterized protein
MSVSLLDVNVLIALFDPSHIHHERAHQWFGRSRNSGWATCPITLNGCIRILSNPAYPTITATPTEVMDHMRAFCSNPHHESWTDSVSLLDETLFRAPMFVGHRVLTDVYLLGLAVRHHGRLATFDGAIPWRAVTGATTRHLELID